MMADIVKMFQEIKLEMNNKFEAQEKQFQELRKVVNSPFEEQEEKRVKVLSTEQARPKDNEDVSVTTRESSKLGDGFTEEGVIEGCPSENSEPTSSLVQEQ